LFDTLFQPPPLHGSPKSENQNPKDKPHASRDKQNP
jgi:hypothetical protein